MNRFAALVAALMLCASLCVPCFASNNASSKKWVVASEANMMAESGVVGRYLQLVPYENGQPVPNTFHTTTVKNSSSTNNYTFLVPVNYPDWWRSAIPLGANAYIGIDNVSVYKYLVNGSASTYDDSVAFYLANSVYSFSFSRSAVINGTPDSDSSYGVVSGPLVGYFSFVQSGGVSAQAQSINVYPGSTSTQLIQNSSQVVFSAQTFMSSPLSFSAVNTFDNLSSDNLVICVSPLNYYMDNAASYDMYVRATISFFVDANKLPAGLKVGDEFPADTDAFDQLRDDLIKQFPEAAENIENGKATIEGWNDIETVDTDVASTSISALNALFQNLGAFLFIVSLMVFGAVVLRMLIRKAVDG